MDADREPNLIPRHGDVCRLPELGDVFGAEDHECTRETGFLGPADDFTEIARELLPGQMAVRVDHDNSQFPTSISQPFPTPKSQSAPSSERWEMDVGSGWALGVGRWELTRVTARARRQEGSDRQPPETAVQSLCSRPAPSPATPFPSSAAASDWRPRRSCGRRVDPACRPRRYPRESSDARFRRPRAA